MQEQIQGNTGCSTNILDLFLALEVGVTTGEDKELVPLKCP